jgi:hypothetical protein
VISFVVATVGRETLARTLASIEAWPTDEIVVVGDVAAAARCRWGGHWGTHVRCIGVARGPAGDWGGTERNLGMLKGPGRYLAFMDDDDTYAPLARKAIQDSINASPGRPMVFRMRQPDGSVLWSDPVMREGNVGTPMFVVPNDRTRLGQWSGRRECDFDFTSSCRWSPAEWVWCPQVIANVRR